VTAEPLPEPDPEACAQSAALEAKVRTAIRQNGGWLPFDRYMQMALYEPGLGYYSAGAAKLGPEGDFTTAPELGDWLAGALAGFIAGQFAAAGGSELIELGAGTGRLAADLLAALAAHGLTDIEYSILETSADLRARQQARLAAAGFTVRWLDSLPEEPIDGIIFGNEVADALPVVRFVKAGGDALPLGVTMDTQAAELRIVPGPADAALSEAVRELELTLGHVLPDGYRSEVCPLLRPWIAGLAAALDRGGILLIDYGMSRYDYYRPDRSDGTLICHYRQRAHADPLRWPGLTDITAWVDFSQVADAARAAGLMVAGYTTQAQFLLASMAGDPALAERQPTPAEASALKTLVLPGEMGERFKLIWLTRGAPDAELPGRDFRNRL